MQVKLAKLTALGPMRVKHFDLHDEYGLAAIVERDETLNLDMNGVVVRSWPKNALAEIRLLKWLDPSRIIVIFNWQTTALVAAESWTEVAFGDLDELYVSPKFLFATYGDEEFYRARPDDLESNIISVFSHNGELEFGIGKLMEKDLSSRRLEQVTAAYTFEDKIAFLAYDSDCFWILDPSRKSWTKFPVPASLRNADFLSGNAARAYAIRDNRRIQYAHPDLPPFELAAFDLCAGSASERDFAPVRAALIAAGFSMTGIKLQRNATGKIIVSEDDRAAFLEIHEGV